MLEALCNQVISLLHDSPESWYFGGLSTTELESTYFDGLGLDTKLQKYVGRLQSIPRTDSTMQRTI